MGHIVLLPGIERFPLVDRLVAALRQRCHRVSILALDPVAATFWQQQDPNVIVVPAADATDTTDTAVVAAGNGAGEGDGALADLFAHRPLAERRELTARLPALQAWLAVERPHLVLLLDERDAASGMVAFAARAAGCRVLWAGSGLLPHTLQIDDRGLDGEASCAQRSAGDFRVVRNDLALLEAALANALARTQPFRLPTRRPNRPTWRACVHAALAVLRNQGLGRALQAYRTLRTIHHRFGNEPELGAEPNRERPPTTALPNRPFLAVLLQSPSDPRLVHDADSPPDPATLVAAACDAAKALDRDCVVVVVRADERTRLPAGCRDCSVVPASMAIDAAAVAAAVVTINHPLASIALLAGTPVLHLGRALYGVRGVAVRTTLASLPKDLAEAVAHDHPTLRQRFLSWVFEHGHVWCSSTQPAHNGTLGLVQAIEARLQLPPAQLPPLHHVKGPGWPLSVTKSPNG